MTDKIGSNHMKSDRKIQIDLLSAIAGDKSKEFFVFACWDYEGGDVEDIQSGVFAVNSSTEEISWKMLYSIDTWIQSIFRFAPECYMLGAASGGLVKVKNGKRETYNTGHFGGICSIWGVSDQNCWLAHDEGLSHWDGQKVSRNIMTEWINLIQPIHSNFALAVGAKGTVLRFDGSEWNEIESVPTNKQLIGIFYVSEGEIYVSGWDGVLYRWDGRDYWEKIEVIDEGGVVTLPIYCPIQYMGEIYIGVGARGVFKVKGKEARKVKDFYCSRTAVIEGKLIVTGANLLVEFDGENWRQVVIAPT